MDKIKDNELGWDHIGASVFACFVAFLYISDGNTAFAFGGLFLIAIASLIPFGIASALKFDYRKITYIISILALSGMSIAGQSGYTIFGKKYDSLEDCIIDKMRGQPQNMGALVRKECIRITKENHKP